MYHNDHASRKGMLNAKIVVSNRKAGIIREKCVKSL